ncbi:type II/IV secretion system ATPase TadZ/CpaE [Vibrio variabilis]|uniref:Type II/IV secretion system ATPase TadZ/CpaE n=1 Tax=Vibrio variabilis TaxID=990271 RepID=A0ABQ0JKB5_9VIBR|nr:type II/IV secretion system ATPase TadZ/CpaE [Vibrio variabilis]
MISSLDSIRESQRKRTRIITLVNHHRPENSFVVKRDELSKFLGSSVDLDIEYCKNLSHLHVDGKQAFKHDRNINRSIDQLVRLVNGQPIQNKSILQRLGIR